MPTAQARKRRKVEEVDIGTIDDWDELLKMRGGNNDRLYYLRLTGYPTDIKDATNVRDFLKKNYRKYYLLKATWPYVIIKKRDCRKIIRRLQPGQKIYMRGKPERVITNRESGVIYYNYMFKAKKIWPYYKLSSPRRSRKVSTERYRDVDEEILWKLLKADKRGFRCALTMNKGGVESLSVNDANSMGIDAKDWKIIKDSNDAYSSVGVFLSEKLDKDIKLLDKLNDSAQIKVYGRYAKGVYDGSENPCLIVEMVEPCGGAKLADKSKEKEKDKDSDEDRGREASKKD
jgi:hypothetical protein